MTISDRQLRSLHNLADKQAGEDVDWVNIADARALTDLGLARRNPSGWEITPEGLALIKSQAGVPTPLEGENPGSATSPPPPKASE